MSETKYTPDYLFEVSWEVCNKVGGIYTVISTKALYLNSRLGRHHILIGPDVWMETESNPDFEEDQSLYRTWRLQAASQGIRVRIGRWNVPGRPTAILVDYKQFLPQQNELLTEYWKRFGVDSLTGNWDYKESALFGYAAGKVIESFYRSNLLASDKVVAQFHEWQCGAGLLYLKYKELPVATVFTTHATMMGRCICSNNLPLYNHLESYNGDEMAARFGVIARHSLEKISAQNSDVLTTVSSITAQECHQFYGRYVDIVTPNGFEDSFTPSSDVEYDSKRAAARRRMLDVATAMTGTPTADNTILVGIGGRYEYHNKGIDVFIDALAALKNHGYDGTPVVAFIMIPSGHNGPDKDLLRKLSGAGAEQYTTQVSHALMNPEWDTISRRIAEVGLKNYPEDKVKVLFIPSYLNGNDGIFNMSYYDLMVGLDATVFPSYYEPWGYTPLESLAFGIPTLTTSLAGFGQWVKEKYPSPHPGIAIVERNDDNYFDVVAAVEARLREIAALDADGRLAYHKSARDVADIALWNNQIKYYNEAYSLAIEKIVSHLDQFPVEKEDLKMEFNKMAIDSPSWKSVMVTRHLPEALSGLETLCKNLWWCWNDSAKALFKSIDPALWTLSGHNPMYILDQVSIKKFKALAKDQEFLGRLKSVMDEFNAYMKDKENRTDPSIAYFCMEYGLDTSLKIYSGGLGILAGDYLKETSDMNVNLTAVGFLYRYGYFTQKLTANGDQVAEYVPQDFLKIPVQPVKDAEGNWQTIAVAFPGRTVTARIWKVAVGRTDLYLLDTDFEANLPEDRQITHQLYGGDWENRLKQEILLGIGGIRAIRKLGIDAKIYHCNEGHAAFTGLERLREYVQNENLGYLEALEVVRASSLFTTHTPVPAGHDAFDEGLLRKYLGHFPDLLKIDWTTMMGLGKIHAEDFNEKFSMSILAANVSQNINGVSMLHGKVSRDIFANMYPGYLPEELSNITYVTNGVHYPTWASKEWKALHATVFGDEFATHHYDKKCFEGIYKLSDEQVWNTRKVLKKELIKNIRSRISDPQQTNHYSPRQIVTISETLRDDILTIGFARRFATYKRATLLFSDLDRLDAIVNNPKHPVQFVFAGKAHPADKAGQDLIKQIVEISKQDRFIGKIVFVPGYDITLAKRMVQGVDVWMNNPTRPQEASGTSGEKASMNGVMHFSVLDGWWVEGYREGAGWALPQERTYDDQNYQNELDSATIYNIIENEIAPAYYDVDENGLSSRWISYIKNTIAQVACNFTTNRMLTDYLNQYYLPQSERSAKLVADDYKVAREIADWKKHVRRQWQNLEVVSYTQPDASLELSEKNELKADLVLNLGDMKPEEIGVEMLFVTTDSKGKQHISESIELGLVEASDGTAHFHASILPERQGMYQVATRIYPKNSLLPHRQDFPLVKWL